MVRPFTPAWLADDPAATRFLPRAFTSRAARAQAVGAALERTTAPALVGAFAAQEARRPWSSSRADNLELLARGAGVVVTGQQVGLLLGPLYTLHKAASAVVAARALSEETGRPVVPVFWLQTEDHDFAEVRSVAEPGAGGLVRHQVADALEGRSRVSLAERVLGPSVSPLIDELALSGPHVEETRSLLARHYRPEATFAEAFAGVLAELFADHGLLIFDPRAKTDREVLVRLSAPIHDLCLEQAATIEAALVRRSDELAASGFEVQVPIRSGASLSCYADGVLAPRYRLQRDVSGAGWVTRARAEPFDVAKGLSDTPERFTTTALSRPLLQDSLLATVATVAGPGEVAYFAQLPPLYALAGLPMPLVVPRARFTLITARIRRLTEQLGLTPDDARRSLPELRAAICQDRDVLAGLTATAQALQQTVDHGISALATEARNHGDRTFDKHADKARAQIAHTLERLRKRVERVITSGDALREERLVRFTSWLAPDGKPQERALGFAAFAAAVGPRALAGELIRNARAFDGSHRELHLT